MNNKYELLMPGGSLEKIKYAIAYGADAVYAGVPRYSLRARENEFFDIDLVAEAVNYTKSQGKKIYLTCNIYAHNNKIRGFMEAIDEMSALKPDAFIMTDPGLIAMTKERHPEIDIHLSTQANNTNWAQVRFWRDYGVKRVILARELNVAEIKEIHEQVPDIELEAFVHGSICMAYSGRCLLSNYLNYRDANQGTCSHTCRWGFKLNINDQAAFRKETLKEQLGLSSDEELRAKFSDTELETLLHTPDDVISNYIELAGDFSLEEKERAGEQMEIDEDEYGTYIMNSKDLCALDYLEELKDAGIISFKVEGRNKTEYYASIVARAYRRALDKLEAGQRLDPETRRWALDELSSTANRGFIPGFYARNAKAAAQEFEKDHCIQSHLYAARIVRYNPETAIAELEVKNRLDKGDNLELISPDGNYKFVLPEVYYAGHPDDHWLSAQSSTWRPSQIKMSEHAHGGGANVFLKIAPEISSQLSAEAARFAILRMPYKEPVSLRARTSVLAQEV